jgi:hypothetical protein
MYTPLYYTYKEEEFDTSVKEISFEKCMQALITGKAYLEIVGAQVLIEAIVPDLSACTRIADHAFIKEEELGEVSSFHFLRF